MSSRGSLNSKLGMPKMGCEPKKKVKTE